MEIDTDTFLLYLHALFSKLHKLIKIVYLCSRMRTKFGKENMFNVLTDGTVFTGKSCKNQFRDLLNFPANNFALVDTLSCIWSQSNYTF